MSREGEPHSPKQTQDALSPLAPQKERHPEAKHEDTDSENWINVPRVGVGHDNKEESQRKTQVNTDEDRQRQELGPQRHTNNEVNNEEKCRNEPDEQKTACPLGVGSNWYVFGAILVAIVAVTVATMAAYHGQWFFPKPVDVCRDRTSTIQCEQLALDAARLTSKFAELDAAPDCMERQISLLVARLQSALLIIDINNASNCVNVLTAPYLTNFQQVSASQIEHDVFLANLKTLKAFDYTQLSNYSSSLSPVDSLQAIQGTMGPPINYREALRFAGALKTAVLPFDIIDFKFYWELQLKEVAGAKDKDLTLQAGPMAATKTTTLHFVGGSVMELVMVDGRKIVIPTIITNPDLCAAHVGKLIGASTTRFARIVCMPADPAKNMSAPCWMDYPGFEDSKGIEVDAVSTLILTRYLQEARSVKIMAYVIPPGNQGTPIYSLSKILSSMVRNIHHVAPSIIYVFARWPQDQQPQILATLRQLLDAQKRQQFPDTEIIFVLESMINYASNQTIIIDQLAGPIAAKELLHTIATSSAIIQKPIAVFKPFLTPQTQAGILRHAKQLQDKILAVNAHKNLQLLRARLRELKTLSDLSCIDSTELLGTISTLVTRLDKLISDETKSIQQAIAHRFLSEGMVRRAFGLVSELSISSVINLLEPKMVVKEAQHLEQILLDTVRTLYHLMRNFSSSSEAPFLPSAFWQSLHQLHTFFRVANESPSFSPATFTKLYEDAVSLVRSILQQTSKTAEAQVAALFVNDTFEISTPSDAHAGPVMSFTAKLESFSLHLSSILTWSASCSAALHDQLCSAVYGLDEFQTIIPNLVEALRSRLRAVVTSTTENRPKVLSEADVSRVKACLDRLHQVARTGSLLAHVSSKDFLAITEQLLSWVQSRFDENVRSATHILNLCAQSIKAGPEAAPEPDSDTRLQLPQLFESLSKPMTQLQLLVHLSANSEIYHDTWRRIYNQLINMQFTVSELLSKLTNRVSMPASSFQLLEVYVDVLNKTSWMQSPVFPQVSEYKLLLEKSRELLFSYADSIVRDLGHVNFDVETGLDEAIELFSKLAQLAPLDSFLPELQARRTDFFGTFSKAVFGTLAKFEADFNLAQWDASQNEKELAQLLRTEAEIKQISHTRLYLNQLGYVTEADLVRDANQATANLTLRTKELVREVERCTTELKSLYEQKSRFLHDGTLLAYSSIAELDEALKQAQTTYDRANNSMASEILVLKNRIQSLHAITECYSQLALDCNGNSTSVDSKSTCPSEVLEAWKNSSSPQEQTKRLQELGFKSLQALEKQISDKQFLVDQHRKHNQSYSFPRLSIETLEKALKYVDSAQHHLFGKSRFLPTEFAALRTRLEATQESLRVYLQTYMTFLTAELRRYFEDIERASMSANLITDLAQLFTDRMDELEQISRTTYANELSSATTALDRQIEAIRKHILTSKAELSEHSLVLDCSQLHAKLLFVDACTPIDKHVRSQPTYSSIHHDYENKLTNCVHFYNQGIQAQAADYNFLQVCLSLQHLPAEFNFLAAYQQTQLSVKKLTVSISKSLRDIKPTVSETDVQKLYDTQCLTSTDALDESTKASIDESFNSVKTFVTTQIQRALRLADNWQRSFKYLDAHQEVAKAQQLASSLCGAAPKLLCNDTQMQTLSAFLDQGLIEHARQAVDTWLKKNILSYAGISTPATLYEELGNIAKNKDVLSAREFEVAQQDLERGLQSQFHNELTALQAQSVLDKEKLQKLEHASTFLSPSMPLAVTVNARLREIKQKVDQERADESSKVQELFQLALDVRRVSIARTIYDALLRTSSPEIGSFQRGLLNAVTTVADQIEKYLSSLNLQAVFAQLQQLTSVLYHVKKTFVEPEFLQVIDQSQTAISVYQEAFRRTSHALTELLKKTEQIPDPSVAANFESSFELFSLFTKTVDVELDTTAKEAVHNELLLYVQNGQKRLNHSLESSPPSGAAIGLELSSAQLFKSTYDKVLVYSKISSDNVLQESLSRANRPYYYPQMVEQVRSRLKASMRVLHDEGFEVKVDPMDVDFQQRHTALQSHLWVVMEMTQLTQHKLSHGAMSIGTEATAALADFGTLMHRKFTSLELEMKTLSEENFSRIRLLFLYVESCRDRLESLHIGARSTLQQMLQIILGRIDDIATQAKKTHYKPGSEQILGPQLVTLQVWADNLPSIAVETNKKIDEVVSFYQASAKTETSDHSFAALSDLKSFIDTLHQKGSAVVSFSASNLLRHTAFVAFISKAFNEYTANQGIDYVLAHMQGTGIDDGLRIYLKKMYDEYRAVWETQVKAYLGAKTFPALIDSIKRLAAETLSPVSMQGSSIFSALYDFVSGDSSSLSSNRLSAWWGTNTPNAIPKLLGHIFALISLQRSAAFWDVVDKASADSYMMKPLAAQVVAVFRLLGMGYDLSTDRLDNALVEVLTGEGKSIILAATAAVLALRGARVSVICFSDDLTARDKNAFEWLFRSLDIDSLVSYGTFTESSEALLNKNGNLREKLTQMISDPASCSGATSVVAADNSNPTILLVDEVDFFFTEAFFGQSYRPVTPIYHPNINALFHDVWSQRGFSQNLNVASFRKRDSFRSCVQVFPQFEDLFLEVLKQMLLDVQTFSRHKYIVSTPTGNVADKRIAYPVHDGLSFEVTMQYQTAFAAMHEHEQKNIASEILKEYLSINLHSGAFSYAAIPHQFDLLLGVTGTLKDLTDWEKAVIQKEYHFQRDTFIPTSFPTGNRVFDLELGLKFRDEAQFPIEIVQEIEEALRGNQPRAVIVFFENLEKLKAFVETPEWIKFYNSRPEKIQLLSEDVHPVRRPEIVKWATTSNSVTLATAPFGRGTDFICRDRTVNENGGVHVIQTFLSKLRSEFVQIQGRTARQGQKGRFSMVLSFVDLEQFNITASKLDGRTGAEKMQVLQEAQSQYAATMTARRDKLVKKAEASHKESLQFQQQLFQGDVASVKRYLLAHNKAQASQKTTASRLHVLMDGTGSMGHELKVAKDHVIDTFNNVRAIIKDAGLDPNSFSVKMSIYRNYNCPPSKALVSSSWEQNPDNLKLFLDPIEPDCGMGAEAIELAFWEVDQECKNFPETAATRLVLIGDREAHSLADLQVRRRAWKQHDLLPFPEADWSTQIGNIRSRSVCSSLRVYPRYIDRGYLEAVRNNFEAIAIAFGGAKADVKAIADEKNELAHVLAENIIEEVAPDVATKDKMLTQYAATFRSKTQRI